MNAGDGTRMIPAPCVRPGDLLHHSGRTRTVRAVGEQRTGLTEIVLTGGAREWVPAGRKVRVSPGGAR